MTHQVPANRVHNQSRSHLGDAHASLRAVFLALALLAIGAVPVGAQSDPAAGDLVSGYSSRIWRTRDGLPQNLIRALLQTRDGYLWIGTSNAGLVRFDGVTFTTFDIINTPGFPSNWISDLHESADGALWIGTGDGLARYQAGTFTSFRLGSDSAHNLVRGIEEGPDGRLWVATLGQVVSRDGSNWTPISLGNPYINNLLLDRSGTLWIGTDTGLIEWREGTRRTWTVEDGLPSNGIQTLFEDSRGRLWVGTRDGGILLDREAGTIAQQAPAALAIAEDRSGVLWFGALGQLFERSVDGRVTAHRLWDPDDGTVKDLMLDREGHLWLAVDGGAGGLVRLRKHSVSVLTQPDGVPCESVVPIAGGRDDTLWGGTPCPGAGVFSMANGRVQQRYPYPAGISSLIVDAGARVWAGTFGGELLRIDGRQLVRQPGPPTESPGPINALHADSAGAIWIGGDRGLFKLQNGSWTSYQTDDGLPGNEIRAIVPDPAGGFWIGTTRGLSRYHNGVFTNFAVANGLPPGPVRAIYPDADGVVWIGTYGGGLSRLKDGRVVAYGTQGGVLDSSVHRIFEDANGHLWMSGDRGIRRASRRDLNAIADGRQAILTGTIYDESDGMKSAECNGAGQPAGWRTSDGVLWFPTQRGIVRVDPRQASSGGAVAANPIVEQVLVDGVPHRGPAVTLPAGTKDVELRFTAPIFDKPERTQFRYRLEGHDRDWVDAGSRRVAHYANLAPGSYRFVVAARASGAQWSESPAQASLVLEPFFFQRVSVRLLGTALLLAGAVALVLFRIERLRRRARDLEATVVERTAEVARQRDEGRAAHVELASANRGLEQAHDRVRMLLDQLDVGALLLDPEGVIRHASEPAIRLLEDAGNPLVGRAWTECLPLSDADRVQIRARLEAPSPSRLRLPVQISLHGRRFLMEIDVRETPDMATPRILYLYEVTEVYSLRAKGEAQDGLEELVGRSTAMHVIFKQIRDVAGVDATVLIEGETGSGKELVARAIHRVSRRGEAVHRSQHGRAGRVPDRESALRPPPRGIYRRRGRSAGRLRGGRRRDPLPRRDRRHPSERAGQSAARAPGARDHAAGGLLAHEDRRALSRGDASRSGSRGGRGALSPGSALPDPRRHDSRAAAPGSGRRHAAARGAVHRRRVAYRAEGDHGPQPGGDERADGLRLAGQRPRAQERDRAGHGPRVRAHSSPRGLSQGDRQERRYLRSRVRRERARAAGGCAPAREREPERGGAHVGHRPRDPLSQARVVRPRGRTLISRM
jgi:ligand-binding sensor domain-containing protein/PAS domain-containing protein